MYTNIIIQNDRFRMVESEDKFQKEKSALTTLNRIEEVIRRELTYSGEPGDKFSELSQEQLLNILKEKAASIRACYREKSAHSSTFKQLFTSISRNKIQKTYRRIEDFSASPLLLKLPIELIQSIFTFLKTQDMCRVARVNKFAELQVRAAQLQRAREYGYKGEDFDAAKKYLKTLFLGVSILVKKHCIHEDYVVQQTRRPFSSYVDSESTLRSIRHIDSEKVEIFNKEIDFQILNYSVEGDARMVESLLLLGANLETVDSEGQTCLALAAKKGHLQITKMLIDAGANTNVLNIRGSTPLMLAIFYSQSEQIFSLLLEKGATASIDVFGNYGFTALHLAVGKNQIENVQRLVQLKADIEAKDKEGHTPLALAAKKGYWSIAKMLIEAGADTNTLNSNGSTPLMLTIFYFQSQKISLLLLENGAAETINNVGRLGYTALHFAAEKNMVEIIKNLILHKADPKLLNVNGKTAFQLATSNQARKWMQYGKID